MRPWEAHPGRRLITARSGRDPMPGWRTHAAGRILVEARVAQRFNAYAAFAYPFEVGGLLRVVPGDAGGWRVIDLRVLEQNATEASFELDPGAVAQHAQSLEASGRGAELGEWRGVVHSHPSMEPFMSGPDRRTLFELAGGGFAFSLICCAHAKPSRNSWAAFYAQQAPLRLMTDIPVRALGGSLSGTELLDSAEHDELARELASVLHRPLTRPPRAWGSASAKAAERNPARAAVGPPALELEHLTAGELALALAVVEERREKANAGASVGPLGALDRLAWRLQNGHRLAPREVELLASEIAAARGSGCELLSRSLLTKVGNVTATQNGGRSASVAGGG